MRVLVLLVGISKMEFRGRVTLCGVPADEGEGDKRDFVLQTGSISSRENCRIVVSIQKVYNSRERRKEKKRE